MIIKQKPPLRSKIMTSRTEDAEYLKTKKERTARKRQLRKMLATGADFTLDESLGLDMGDLKEELNRAQMLQSIALDGVTITGVHALESRYLSPHRYLTIEVSARLPGRDPEVEPHHCRISIDQVLRVLQKHKFKTKFQWGHHRLYLDEESE